MDQRLGVEEAGPQVTGVARQPAQHSLARKTWLVRCQAGLHNLQIPGPLQGATPVSVRQSSYLRRIRVCHCFTSGLRVRPLEPAGGLPGECCIVRGAVIVNQVHRDHGAQ